MDRYARMFERLAKRAEGAFGAFVMLGDPDPATSARILDLAVEAGADMVEVGIPFSDPVADGPVIQAAAGRALAAGVRPADCLAMIADFRGRHPEIPVGILTYANLVVARGRDAFYRAAAEAGADSVLIADVPVIEAEPFVRSARRHAIATVLIAADNTPADRLAHIAALGGGYTYCVTRRGVTGASDRLEFGHGEMLATLRANHAAPPVFGFGISSPAHVRAALAAGAAGVICGSALIRILAEPGEDRLPRLAASVAELKAATRPAAAAPRETQLSAAR